MNNIDKTYKIRINTAWQEEKTSGKIYIKELKKGDFYYFDDVSKEIWLLIKNRKSIEEIKSILMDRYDIGYKIISEDVEEFIKSLEVKEIIQEV